MSIYAFGSMIVDNVSRLFDILDAVHPFTDYNISLAWIFLGLFAFTIIWSLMSGGDDD